MTQTYEIPNLTTFDPSAIPMQKRVIKDIKTFDYSLGTHEVFLSGSVGSAKSILMAHIALRHVIENPKARLLIGRRTLPDLKSTIYQKILEHMDSALVEGDHYTKNDTTANIKFRNGSEIISRSWADNKPSKMRSLELSAAIIEELAEKGNEEPDFYREIKMRVGRLPAIKTNFILSASNPDSPAHWAYKYFMESDSMTRHVYYSVTSDNPFLPKSYIAQLKKDLDPKMARRMLFGEWIEIADEVIYYAYDKDHNFIKAEYTPDYSHPVYISWDFNIGEGKPLSLCMFQYINDTYHFFDEVVVGGMRTLDSLDELVDRGMLSTRAMYYITGDAAGKHRDTRSRQSDYELIRKFFANSPYKFEMRIFPSNPPIRTRHNMVNAYCLNADGKRRLFVYNKAKTVDEGLRLTALKKGANLIEDDSKHYQHITTAVGYGLHAVKLYDARTKQQTRHL